MIISEIMKVWYELLVKYLMKNLGTHIYIKIFFNNWNFVNIFIFSDNLFLKAITKHFFL